MKTTTIVLSFIASSLLSTMCVASTLSSHMEEELNVCRQEYKDLVDEANRELAELRETAPINLPNIYNERQKQLNQKVADCKKIKNYVEQAKKFEIETLPVRETPEGRKVGPSFRCLQLGQTWSEFEACIKSIGYTPEIRRNNRKSESENKFMFSVIGHNIDALLDKYNRIQEFKIQGGEFWGTERFDEHFLRAFMHNYDIDELVPNEEAISEALAIAPLAAAFGKKVSLENYKGEISGGAIKINLGSEFISIKKNPPAPRYTF